MVKKLFPEVPDVLPSVANRATRIIEKHLRIHHVNRAKDLPEEARIRLYRDLKFFFESGSAPPGTESQGKGFSFRAFFSQLWGKIEDFLSASEITPVCAASVMAWVSVGEPAKLTVLPLCGAALRSNEQ